jgi:FKBP-type peptidyl-prolyl cis-trans isomerase
LEERGYVRKIATLAIIAGLVVSLAGCSTSTPSGACTPSVTSGDTSSTVTAAGAFGSEPKVTMPTPLVVKKPEVSIITKGAGKTIYPGQNVDFQATVLNAKTGDVISATSFDKTSPARAKADTKVTGIGPALQCVTVGSRLAVALTVRDFVGKQGLDPTYNLGLNDTLVFVVDVVAKYLGRADGVDQILQAGFPTVVLASDGQPGITIPHQNPLSDLQIEVLKRGAGPRVKKDDFVVLAYTGVDWTTQKVFDTTWGGSAVNRQAKNLDPTDGSGLVDGFTTALIGQTVGSQVLVVVPPKEGFPSDALPTGVSKGSTLIFVFDVLGIAS